MWGMDDYSAVNLEFNNPVTLWYFPTGLFCLEVAGTFQSRCITQHTTFSHSLSSSVCSMQTRMQSMKGYT